MRGLIVLFTLVFGLNVYSQTAVLKNFRIEDSNKNRVYFDSSEPISGSGTSGFYISGKSISGVNIVSGGTSGHYFSVSSPFTFWDNNTIRYEGGSSLNVQEFTLSYIENNISEPEASNYRYVTTAATGSGDGTSEAKAWTISQGVANAMGGMTIWVKAGDYGNVSLTLSKSGSSSNPIKYIGYKSIPGDITSNYFDYGVPMSSKEMPTLTGVSVLTDRAFIVNSDYFILRNFQTKNHKTAIRSGSNSGGNIVIERLNVKDNFHITEPNISGISLASSIKLNNIRITDCTLINCSMSGIVIQGTNSRFNLIDGIKSYNDRTETVERQDYHISINGDHNIIRNCYAENFNNTKTNVSTHGIGIKGQYRTPNEYNLIEKSTVVNNLEGFYFRNYGCNYSVIKDCLATKTHVGGYTGEVSGGIWIWGGNFNNIIERCKITNVSHGIGLKDNEGEDNAPEPSVGSNNIIRNSIVSNCKNAIYSSSNVPNAKFNNNQFLNLTFNNNQIFHKRGNANVVISNLEISNSIFNNVNSGGDGTGGMVFSNNNFYNSWVNTLGVSSLNVDPKFENASAGNFRLKPDSPLINKGKKLNTVQNDFLGNSRPQGSSHDIGAYEYQEKTTSSIKADAGKDQTICAGSNTTLTASGGSVYKWSTGATTESITVSPGATTTYSVTVSEGSDSDTDEVLVTVNPLPIADAGTDVTIESGQSSNLTATGGDTYLWSNGANTASITVNPTVTTTYEVTVNKNGCTSKDTVTVIVNTATAPPVTVTADAGQDQTICAGNSTTLTASGGSVYKWSTGATTKSITVSPSATTTYSVTVSEGSVSDTDEVLVTINPLPIADAGKDVTIESGQSTTLTATGGDTYLWSNGATTASITVNPTATTTYEVTVNKNGCTSKDTVTVTVNTATTPPATVTADAGKDQTICAGSSATLTASGGSVYKWSTGATTMSITVSPGVTTTYSVTVSEGSVSDTDEVIVTVNEVPLADAGTDVTIESGQSTTLTATGGDTYIWSNGAATASITVNPTVTTTYEVTVNKNGCTSKDTVTVIVNTATAPPVTVTADAGQDQTICIGNSTTLTASGGSVYKWSTGATTKSITVSPGTTTTYSVTVSEGSVSDTDEVLVTVNPLPVADAGSNKTIELGQSVELTATGGDTYLWSTGETTQSITVKPGKSTIYSVTVNQNGCSSGDSVQVTVNVPPPADANAGSDLTICKGESITLNGDGGATYSWSTGATTRNITVSPNRTTTYTLTANRGGTTSTDEVIVTVINCDLNNGVNNSVSGTTGNTATTDPTDQDDEQVLNKADFELTVYPNPTEGKLNVQTTVPIYNFNLVLMNINGNVIYSDEMDAAEDGINKEIDLSGFAKGVYLLQLYNAEESYVKKVIVI